MSARDTRTGVLVVRAWVEGDSSSGLRARVVSTLDVNRNESESRIAASVDDVTGIVRDWLNSLVTTTQPVPDD
jgi:hypothetical protein